MSSIVHPSAHSPLHPRVGLVFDLGGVLIDWRPQVFVNALLPGLALGEAERDWLLRCVFQDYGPNSDWVAFDLNRLDLDVLCARIAGRLSRENPPVCSAALAAYLAQARPDTQAVKAWIVSVAERLQPLAEHVAWLRSLHQQAFPLFYLSNMPRLFIPKVIGFRELFGCFEAGIFSGEVHLAKPDPAIFALAAARFTRPGVDSFIFFDDHPANVAAADRCGWQGIHFDSLQSARSELERILAA